MEVLQVWFGEWDSYVGLAMLRVPNIIHHNCIGAITYLAPQDLELVTVSKAQDECIVEGFPSGPDVKANAQIIIPPFCLHTHRVNTCMYGWRCLVGK